MLQSEREGLGRDGGLSKTRAGWGGGSWWCAVKKKSARGGEGLAGLVLRRSPGSCTGKRCGKLAEHRWSLS